MGNLHFIGQRSNVGDYLSAADVMLLTSREDPYPTVVMEALATGVPVMAFDECGGFVELLDNQHFGHLIPFGDLEGLASSIITVCEQPDNERKAKRALRVFLTRERFNFRNYAFSLLQLVRKGTKQYRNCPGRLIPLAPALPTFGDERAIGARVQPATDKMLIAPEATA